MTYLLQSARIDSDLLIWLFVVGFTLVSQIVRAMKQKPRQGRPAPPGSERPGAKPLQSPIAGTDAQKELEDFLRSLGGMPAATMPNETAAAPPAPRAAPVVRAPPPAPVAAPRATPNARASVSRAPAERGLRKSAAPARVPVARTPVARPAARITTVAPPPPAPRKPEPVPAPAGAAADAHYLARESLVRRSGSWSDFRKGLNASMADRESLRRAIVLREIIDPPLALRRPRPYGS